MSSIRLGDLPENILPATTKGQVTLITAVVGIVSTITLTNPDDAGITLLFFIGLCAAFYLYSCYITANERDGYLFDKPKDRIPLLPYIKPEEGEISTTATNFLHGKGMVANVYKERRAQYDVYRVNNTNPDELKKHLKSLAMTLGANPQQCHFVEYYQAGASAFIIARNPKDWDDVTIDKSALVKGKLISYVGQAINGDALTFDRRLENHCLISGDSNAGKTYTMKADIESVKQSGLNPYIVVIDTKEEFKNVEVDKRIIDREEAIQYLESILLPMAAKRKSRYAKHNAENYFEYQARVDAAERPIMLYVDETATLLTENLADTVEKDEHPLHKRAFYALYTLTYLHRASGVFVTLGMQHPQAKLLPTLIRHNLGARIALSVVDDTASKVAIDHTGAENLPKFGAFLFKCSYIPLTLGRSAIPSNTFNTATGE